MRGTKLTPMKNGFRVLDSDLHTMEPDGLWERYLDEPFKKFAPRFTRHSDGSVNQPLITIGDLEIVEMSKRARTAVVGILWDNCARLYKLSGA